MPNNNERSFSNAIDNGIWYLKNSKETAKKIDKKYEDVKNSVKWGINSISNWFSETWKSIENKVNKVAAATKETYRDVSNSVKNSIDTWRKNTKEVAKNTLQYAEQKVIQLENFKQKLIIDSAKGLIKWITIAKNTGMMIVDYGTRKVNVFVGTARQEIAALDKKIQAGTIKAMTLIENTWEVIVTNIKWGMERFQPANMLAAGKVARRGWKFVFNEWVKNIHYNIKKVSEEIGNVTQKVSEKFNKRDKESDKIANSNVKHIKQNPIVENVINTNKKFRGEIPTNTTMLAKNTKLVKTNNKTALASN